MSDSNITAAIPKGMLPEKKRTCAGILRINKRKQKKRQSYAQNLLSSLPPTQPSQESFRNVSIFLCAITALQGCASVPAPQLPAIPADLASIPAGEEMVCRLGKIVFQDPISQMTWCSTPATQRPIDSP